MRAASLPLFVGVVTFSRTYRADLVATAWYVRLDRPPDIVAAVDQLEPSVLVWMVYAPVFQPVVSPPRPACLTTNCETFMVEPRSTCRNFVPDASEHHLLLLDRLPSTALSDVSLEAQGAEDVVGLFSARLVPRFG